MGLQEELTAALDPDRVATGDDERRRHGTDEGWHQPAAPDVVVYPRTPRRPPRSCGSAARTARRSCRSARARRSRATSPRCDGGVSVDMTQMDAILRLSVEDMDVTVQAGVTRRQLDEKLRPEGVFFSVDPGADATIGGMAATGASGTTAVRYGTMRENVLALTVSPPTARSSAPARGRASRRPATTSRGCSSARRARSG